MYISNSDNKYTPAVAADSRNGLSRAGQMPANKLPTRKADEPGTSKAGNEQSRKVALTTPRKPDKKPAFALESRPNLTARQYTNKANQHISDLIISDRKDTAEMSATRQAYQAVDTDSTPVRGTIVEERGSSRRVQMAISTYHANQHLEERYEFTAALGIDEYA